MHNPNWKSLASSFVAIALLAAQPSLAQSVAEHRSATLATDINGFRLGMSLAEVNAITPLTPIGGGQFDAIHEGITYNFETTPLRRIFRVQSSQELGNFRVDRNFLVGLRTRLIDKYGRPTGPISETTQTFFWELIERVRNANGRAVPYKTMWMTAYVSSSGSTASLEMTIIDFRILWEDEAAVNRSPSEEAEGRIRF